MIVYALRAVEGDVAPHTIPEMANWKGATTGEALSEIVEIKGCLEAMRAHPLLQGLNQNKSAHWTPALNCARAGSGGDPGKLEKYFRRDDDELYGFQHHSSADLEVAKVVLSPGADPLRHVVEYLTVIEREIEAYKSNARRNNTVKLFFDHAIEKLILTAQTKDDLDGFPLKGFAKPLIDLGAALFGGDGSAQRPYANSLVQWTKSHQDKLNELIANTA